MRGIGLVLLLLITACAADARGERGIQPLALRIERTGRATRLVLTAASGWKINARLKPALETTEGSIIRFDAARLTPDSAYFAEPPYAVLPPEIQTVAGRLRASVCAAGERVCRVVTVIVAPSHFSLLHSHFIFWPCLPLATPTSRSSRIRSFSTS